MKRKFLGVILLLAFCAGFSVPVMAGINAAPSTGYDPLGDLQITNIVSTGVCFYYAYEMLYEKKAVYATAPVSVTAKTYTELSMLVRKIMLDKDNVFTWSNIKVEPVKGTWIEPEEGGPGYYSGDVEFILESGVYFIIENSPYDIPQGFVLVVSDSSATATTAITTTSPTTQPPPTTQLTATATTAGATTASVVTTTITSGTTTSAAAATTTTAGATTAAGATTTAAVTTTTAATTTTAGDTTTAGTATTEGSQPTTEAPADDNSGNTTLIAVMAAAAVVIAGAAAFIIIKKKK